MIKSCKSQAARSEKSLWLVANSLRLKNENIKIHTTKRVQANIQE